jgi:hexosaminidase
VRCERAVFLVDIMNPCRKLPAIDLSEAQRLTASVGQVPFNFQIGADIEKIALRKPQSPAGELEIRIGCDGELVGAIPLATAAGNPATTTLPTIDLPARAGVHDLCFQFTQAKLDPMWVLDRIDFAPSARRSAE